jgi:heavy metal translocating P-type ATPase
MCALCGLPVRHSGARQVLQGETLHFCCTGCLNVFQILFNRPEGVPVNFRETDLYRACIESGLIPRDEKDPVYQQAQINPRGATLSQDKILEQANHAQDVTLRIDGMWCTACGWLIEEVLNRTQGIVEAKVFFLSDMAHITYIPQSLGPQDILARIRRLGYRPSLFEDSLEVNRERKDLLLRVGISAFLTANIMMISFALYMGFLEDLTQQGIRYLSYPLWVLATPVIFYGGFSILRRAIAGLCYGKTSMDTLISVGALSAYVYSAAQVLKGSLHIYFDTASMLITLVLLGRYIESRAKDKLSRGVTELYRLAYQKVRLWIEGKERWVSSDALQPGDEFLVRSGERVPMDGRILSGSALFDESVLSGESKPVRRKNGDEVMGGALLLEGTLKLAATRIAQEGSLKQMIALMQEALSKKNPFELMADRMMRWFVPTVLLVAVATALFLILTGASGDVALLRALTVVVIACPCALGIAAPLAKVAAIGAGRERGLLIRDPSALEKVKDLDVLILDKTGTVTEGNFSLNEVVTREIAKEEALRVVASVEQYSDHYLAKEIVRNAHELAGELEKCEGCKSIEGFGIRGKVRDKDVAVGNQPFMKVCEMTLSPNLERHGQLVQSKGMTVVFFGWNDKAQGLLVLGDSLKEGALHTVQQLEKRGVTVWLVSGDAEATTRSVASELGIHHVFGQMLPQGKVDLIKTLQNEGRRVGMVGDGINDAAALAQADVGIAIGTLMNITQEASDITLLTNDLPRVIEAFELSTLTMRTVKQNLLFALVYNGLGIPLAVAGVLNPVIAVFAMLASSLSVIGNSLRIFKAKKVRPEGFGIQCGKFEGATSTSLSVP